MSGVLAERYASDQMRELWSRTYKIKAERELWISVLKAQAKAGLEISDSVIADYVKTKDVIDIAEKYSASRMMFVLEGGYEPINITEASESILSAIISKHNN